LHITIPANTTALLSIPCQKEGSIYEGGKPVEQSVGIHYTGIKNSRAVLQVGSGRYRFAVKEFKN